MVHVAIEVTATTTAEEELSSPVKEVSSQCEEEATIEVDLSGITDKEDCREPFEESAESSLEDVADERTQEEILSQSEQPQGLKPNIVIERRSRTMPTFNVNSIANITYADAPEIKESALSADLHDGLKETKLTLDQSARIASAAQEDSVENSLESKQTVGSVQVKADLADSEPAQAEAEARTPGFTVSTDVSAKSQPVDVDLVRPTTVPPTSKPDQDPSDDDDTKDSIKPIASASSSTVDEKIKATKAPSQSEPIEENKTATTRMSRIGRSGLRIRSSSTKRARQMKATASALSGKISETSKSAATSSKSMASTIALTSSRRIRETSKSLATSSKSALANVRARSKSRVRGSEGQVDSKPAIEAKQDNVECTSFDADAAVGDLSGVNIRSVTEPKPEEAGLSTDIQVPAEVKEISEMVEEKPTDSITIASAKPEADIAKQAASEPAALINEPSVPTSPTVKSSSGGFMGRFFSGLFCKTDDYFGDITTLCGGAAAVVVSPVAAQTGVKLSVIQRAMESPRSPSTINAVEVKPIFDEPSISAQDVAVPSEEEVKSPTCSADPITASLEPTSPMDFQSSPLHSTKSNKSLTLITEVKSQPSTESFKDGSTPTQAAAAPESNVVSGRSESAKKMDLRIDSSLYNKPDQTLSSDDNNRAIEENEEVQLPPFTLKRSLKAGLKWLSPRGSAVFEGFKRSPERDEEQSIDCQSPVIKPLAHLEGIRIYGGGVTTPVEDKKHYPKYSLDYKRKKGGLAVLKKQMNKHTNHIKQAAMTYSKVLQHQMVKASQPKVRAIMTNHVHQKDPPTNRLY